MGTTLDYSPASWHIVANGANIDAEHRVTREKFSGTVDAFNAMVKAKGYPGIDAIDSIIENPRRVPVTALLSDGRVGNPGGPLLMSVGDASIGVAGNPGCGPYKKSELLPTHRAVFNPELASLSDVTTTAGVVASLDNETEPGEFYRKSLVFTMAGAAASNVQRVLLPADTLFGSTKRKFGYHTHLRIYCSDWSKVTNLSLSPYTGASDMHEFWIVKSGVCDSGCMDPAFSSRWNAKFRTFQFHASTQNKGGSPAAWELGAVSQLISMLTGSCCESQHPARA